MHEIEKGLQNIKFSTMGTHHQNGIAEQGIQTILMKAQTLLIHAAVHWPAQADSDLWPMAVDYALHHHNHMPHPSMGCFPLWPSCSLPIQHTLISKTCMFGASLTFFLEPSLQDGHKLPKWKPQPHCSLFVGVSPCHSALVPLILNPQTGKISPQLHVVFDNWFTSILSVGSVDAFDPSTWQDLFTTRYQYLFDKDDPLNLGPDWLQNLEHDHNQHDAHNLNTCNHTSEGASHDTSDKNPITSNCCASNKFASF